MKRKLLLLLMGITLSLTGCNSSVSQEVYYVKVVELAELEEAYDAKVNELELLQADYEAKVKELETAQKDILDLQSKFNMEHTQLIKSQAELDAITNSNTKIEDESLRLFEDIYVPYANREKPFTFESVKTLADSCEYETEIVSATNDTNASIKISTTNGDYVYFAFSPINGINMITIVSFYQASSNSEVSLSNYSSDGSALYDTYDIHIIGDQLKDVNGIDDQRNFLFKNKP